MGTYRECPVCNSQAIAYPNYDINSVFYVCPVCGRFQLTILGQKIQNNPRLASFLYYNCFLDDGFEYRYHSTLSKETCDEYRKNYDNGDISHGRPVHMDNDIVECWYPKTFAERIDRILLRLNELTKHIGETITLEFKRICCLLFIDLIEDSLESRTIKRRDVNACYREANYMLEYLEKASYIKCFPSPQSSNPDKYQITLTPEGYSRIDVLQKNTSSGRSVLVAMKFGDDTLQLREAIRKGIEDAGYVALFIDEVQHNDFITPELLKHIRDSRFVVVDLTHQNNGAYFEEGYAMGLGKPVIQLCKKDTRLHFDIAQKNTIMWATEDDIPERLFNRIKATID